MSLQYNHSLQMVSNGELRTKEDVNHYATILRLDSTTRGRLMTLIGENKSHYKENIGMLESTSIVSTSRAVSLIKNTWLQNWLAPVLKEKDRTLEQLLTKEWLEGWLLVTNRITWPKELKFIYNNIHKIISTQQREIYNQSEARVYDDIRLKKYGRRTFTPKEAQEWAQTSVDALMKAIEDLAEWRVVEREINNKTVQVLEKKPEKKDTD